MQVVIVGAGPTGAALALLLVKRGISVTLVEAAKDCYRVFRGEGLMPSGLDAIAQMGLSSMLPSVPHRKIDGWEFKNSLCVWKAFNTDIRQNLLVLPQFIDG
ncbi:FAD-dependent oxidoreductase [Microcoleus sp.]|uniref:FAD-dependent oxidoreductase n=1 Tax=Microcoleus sp. TaxID=44472 RepID=UPI003523854C